MNSLNNSPLDSEKPHVSHGGDVPDIFTTESLELKGKLLRTRLKLGLLIGAVSLNMAIGGHMKAAPHALSQTGKLNSKESMPVEQKRLRKRKRKKKR